MKNQRSLETVAIGSAIKYGGKTIYRLLPHLKIIFWLILVRLSLKKKVTFKQKYMFVASKWADRLGIHKTHQYTYSFPAGLRMHRAVGIPEYDNSEVITVMGFTPRDQNLL